MKKIIFLLALIVVLSGCARAAEQAQPVQPDKTAESTETASSAPEENNEEENINEEKQQGETENRSASVNVAALKGATAIGLVNLMENGGEEYNFSVVTTDEIVPLIAKGEVDIAAVPANLASVLYNNTKGAVSVISINTLGVLYIAEKGETVKTVADLKGKTIYASGKGAVPEYALNYILSKNGIDPSKDVNIEYKSEQTEVVASLVQSENGIAMLPQPFVSIAQSKINGLNIALDLTEEWEKVENGQSSLITGVYIARNEFIENNPGAVEKFLSEYENSSQLANKNPQETVDLTYKYGIFPEGVSSDAIKLCNIIMIDGKQMKDKLQGYLQVLFDAEPKSVGGVLPDEKFYFNAES